MRKILLPIVLVLLSAMSSFGQNTWNGGSVSTISTNGSIGLGSATPAAKVDISTTTWHLKLGNSNTGGVPWYIGTSSNDWSSGGGKFVISPTSVSQDAHFVITSAGHVGIGTISPSSSYGLSVEGGIYAHNSGIVPATAVTGITSDGWGGYFEGNYGVWGKTNSTYGTIGVRGTNYRDNMVGVEGDNGGDDGVGVLGINNAVNGGYAGYFDGDMYVTGTYGGGTSDRRFKENERLIQGALNKIILLKPKTYNFKNPADFPNINLPKGNCSGLIAQELQEVLPDLVKTQISPRDEGKEFLSVDYISLIPYLISAIQEQQQTINELKSAKAFNEARIENVDSKVEKSNTLYQNNPNPFDQATTIKYSLLGEHKNANIFVYNLNGEQIKKFELTSKGEGKIDINGGELKAGMYIYSLIVDGKEVETKRMILTK